MIDLCKMSVVELKSLGFDYLLQKQNAEQVLSLIKQEILAREQKARPETLEGDNMNGNGNS